MALLVTRSKEFSLYDFDFVKDVDLMTPEVLYKGRRKTTDFFFLGGGFLQFTPGTVLANGEQR